MRKLWEKSWNDELSECTNFHRNPLVKHFQKIQLNCVYSPPTQGESSSNKCKLILLSIVPFMVGSLNYGSKVGMMRLENSQSFIEIHL